MCSPKFQKNDKIYSIYDFLRNPLRYGTLKSIPIEAKICQVVQLKDGTYKYCIKDYAFTDDWIGKIIFYNKEDVFNFLSTWDDFNDYNKIKELKCQFLIHSSNKK